MLGYGAAAMHWPSEVMGQLPFIRDVRLWGQLPYTGASEVMRQLPFTGVVRRSPGMLSATARHLLRTRENKQTNYLFKCLL